MTKQNDEQNRFQYHFCARVGVDPMRGTDLYGWGMIKFRKIKRHEDYTAIIGEIQGYLDYSGENFVIISLNLLSEGTDGE